METSDVTQDQRPIVDDMQPTGTIQVPAPTAWPMVLGLGIALMLAGLVTSGAISLLGLVMVVPAVVGWFLQVLPCEHHVYVGVRPDVIEIKSTREALAYLPFDEQHRKLLLFVPI